MSVCQSTYAWQVIVEEKHRASRINRSRNLIFISHNPMFTQFALIEYDIGLGCPRSRFSTSILSPQVDTTSTMEQILIDLKTTDTMKWSSFVFVYDSSITPEMQTKMLAEMKKGAGEVFNSPVSHLNLCLCYNLLQLLNTQKMYHFISISISIYNFEVFNIGFKPTGTTVLIWAPICISIWKFECRNANWDLKWDCWTLSRATFSSHDMGNTNEVTRPKINKLFRDMKIKDLGGKCLLAVSKDIVDQILEEVWMDLLRSGWSFKCNHS